MKEITITPHALGLLYKEQNGNAIRLYLYYLSEGNAEKEGAQRSLKLSNEEYASAYARLMTLELLPSDRHLEIQNPPDYTNEEISRIVGEDIQFRELVNYTEARLGHIIAVREIQTLLNIYHWQGLPCEVLMLLVNYCSLRAEELNRKLTMSAVQSTANRWLDKGVDTQEKADKFLRSLEKQNQYITEVTRRLRIDSLTPTVEGYIRTWAERGTSLELVDRAADISGVRFGTLNLRYINGILQGWYQKGLLSLEAIERAEGRREDPGAPRPFVQNRTQPQKQSPGPNSKEQEALRRAQEYYEKKRLQSQS